MRIDRDFPGFPGACEAFLGLLCNRKCTSNISEGKTSNCWGLYV